ncbi:unnamed protein product, partial [Mesorhabditis spiculigera]
MVMSALTPADLHLRVYVASITSNPETRKNCQKTVMLLEGLQVPCDLIDITKPEHAKSRALLREKANNERQKVPLPPQFFYDEEYLGNYIDFEEAVELDKIAEFLRLVPDERWTKSLKTVNSSENAWQSSASSSEADEESEDDEDEDEDEDKDEDEEEDEEADEEADEAALEGDEEEDEEEKEPVKAAAPKEEPKKAVPPPVKVEEEVEDESEWEYEDESEWEDEEEEDGRMTLAQVIAMAQKEEKEARLKNLGKR